MRIARWMCLAAVMASSGCATFNVPWLGRSREASARNPVVKIMCMWEPAEGRDPNGHPCRGFAGQILFLANRGGLPVHVHGDVTIHVFDDIGTPAQQAEPIHTYKFNDLAWSQHLKEGTFGAAYYVFVPYTRPGVHEANCAVRIALTPPNGHPVYSDLGNIKLEGKSRAVVTDTESPPPETPGFKVERQSRSTSIPLEGLQRKEPPALDSDRVNRLLEEFLQNAAEKQQVEEPQTSVERIRFDGQRTHVVPRNPPPQTADADEATTRGGT